MKWMVCGSRKKGYEKQVHNILDNLLSDKRAMQSPDWKPESIIEGCCPNSADEYAEHWAVIHGIPIEHHPGTKGHYLKRNIEMVNKADLIIAFHDHYSYGTAQTIANAARTRKSLIIKTIEVRT